jgi:hypothetical protein
MTWKERNNQWNGGIAAQHAPKIRVQKSTEKVLASIFWGEDSILFIDYLPKAQSINAEYYLSLLVQSEGKSLNRRIKYVDY